MSVLPLIGRVRSLFMYDRELEVLRDQCHSGLVSVCDELDGELLLRACEGQRYAMDELLGRHYAPLYRFVRRLCRNDHDAEDIVHTIFVSTTLERLERLARRVETEREKGQMFVYRAYLMRSARNRFLDEKKLAWNAWRQVVEDQETLTWLCDQGQVTNGHINETPDLLATERLLRALARLPAEQEEALTLKVSGFSMEEIAGIQGVPFETARDRRRTAVRKLRSWLSDVEVLR